MDRWTDDPHRVSFDGEVSLDALPTRPPTKATGDAAREALADHVRSIAERQRLLFADGTHAVLMVFQGMDASGKDSTIRHVLSGVNPAGCAVWSFKKPSDEARDHDFLWRCQQRLPRRGTIGVFNRSHYEEVLVVRVHPQLLPPSSHQPAPTLPERWDRRFRAIRDWERHLSDQGTVVLKFFLHLSRQEQTRRLIRRLDRPNKTWKFDPSDLAERDHWDDYQHAYEQVLRETSRPWAPWYAIPADHKPTMRLAVARILDKTLARLPLSWPDPPPDDVLAEARARLALGAR